jgi:hypothetical protein
MPPLLFMHIHKTAGTSVTKWLDQQFEPDVICPLNCDYQIEAAEDLRRYKLFRGHITPGVLSKKMGGPVRAVTFLREPMARLWSAYRFWRDAGRSDQPHLPPVMRDISRMTFDEFLSSETTRPCVENVQWRLMNGSRFGHENSTRIFVEHGGGAPDFAFIGDSADLASGLRAIAKILHVPPPPAPPVERVGDGHPIPPHDQDAMIRATHLDAILYKSASLRP